MIDGATGIDSANFARFSIQRELETNVRTTFDLLVEKHAMP